MSELDIPIGIYIKVPHARPKRIGVHSTSHHTARRFMARYSGEEYTLIERAAKILGITEAVFASEAAINTAKAIIKLAEKENANHQDRGG